jgi:Asp-tRNA(Asn)/Glu-tRNA(Gln) amidotransferase A subunit family amidase
MRDHAESTHDSDRLAENWWKPPCSSRELLDAYITCIESDDDVINAVVVRDFERARVAAAKSEV